MFLSKIIYFKKNIAKDGITCFKLKTHFMDTRFFYDKEHGLRIKYFYFCKLSLPVMFCKGLNFYPKYD